MPGPALVVGLGNPGPEYADTRHNIGFHVVELLAARAGGGRFSRHKSNADVLEGRLDGRRVVLAKPRTYMNLSGGSVAGALRFYKVPLEQLVVVHDELDLPYGTIRLKLGGGENGPRVELTRDDFALKQQVIEMFDRLNRLPDGSVAVIHVQHGLPCRLTIEQPA